MNDYYDFMAMNDDLYPQNLEIENQMLQHNIAFPQNVQDSIGLSDMNNIMNNNIKSNCGMFNSTEGFEKGNMFPKLFDPYKNWRGNRLNPTSEREAMLLEIQKLDFAMKDINLYLDVHPNDNCMIRKFNEYLDRKNKLLRDYETAYGPITLSMPNNSLDNIPWAWTQIKSPWERGV